MEYIFQGDEAHAMVVNHVEVNYLKSNPLPKVGRSVINGVIKPENTHSTCLFYFLQVLHRVGDFNQERQ